LNGISLENPRLDERCFSFNPACRANIYKGFLTAEDMKKENDVMFLKGKRLYLRQVRREDIPLFLKWTNDPDLRWLYLKRYFPVDEIDGIDG
jgi:hypothetical protein